MNKTKLEIGDIVIVLISKLFHKNEGKITHVATVYNNIFKWIDI